MAPETLIYNEYSFASDIWALGCILYELCMLHAAFDSVEVRNETKPNRILFFFAFHFAFHKEFVSIFFSHTMI